MLGCDPDTALDRVRWPGTFAEYGQYLRYVNELQHDSIERARARAREEQQTGQQQAEAVRRLAEPGHG